MEVLRDEEITLDNNPVAPVEPDNEQLVEKLDEISKKLDYLTEEETEEETEDVTQEVTEEVTEISYEDQPLQKSDAQDLSHQLAVISHKLDLLNDNFTTEEEIVRSSGEEESSEEDPQLAMIQDSSEDDNGELQLVDHGVDGHLYMSTQVENADLNDVYSMLLSTRNVLLLGVMLGLIVACFLLFRMAIERLLYR